MPDFWCLSMNSLQAISFGLSGYALATLGIKVPLRLMAWLNGHLEGSFPALGSLNTLANWAYCGGSLCLTLAVAWARDVERMSLLMEGWFSPSILCPKALSFCCRQMTAASCRLCCWQAPRYCRKYFCSSTSGSSYLGTGVHMR